MSSDRLTQSLHATADRAREYVSTDRLLQVVTGLVDIASPTGGEAPLAAHIAEQLGKAGIQSGMQPLDESQANAWGRISGTGSGADLLLYAPIDTLTTGTEDEDLPWIGPELRPDMRPAARHDGHYVTGLGAGNPKGHAACILMVAEAISAAGLELAGNLLLGFGAGGMPTNALPGSARQGTGQGRGCAYLLEQGMCPDYAVIAKPGWAVSWEEVGLAWFEVTVHGTHTYVGSRHRLPYSNCIESAGRVVQALEAWFPEYALAHADERISPQGVVASIEAGWPRMAAVTPALCRFMVDLRLSPHTSPAAAAREFGQVIDRIRTQIPGTKITWTRRLSIPGTATDPHSWIVRSAVSCWERSEGHSHIAAEGTSGATDANILRMWGIPTVRIGMPKITDAPFDVDFSLGMNLVDLREMERLSRYLIGVALDTLGRSCRELDTA